jgi:glutamate formiminotransferase
VGQRKGLNMQRDDVERIVENILRELTIEVKDGEFTSPNNRTIILKLGDRELSRTWFDVVQTREYEG